MPLWLPDQTHRYQQAAPRRQRGRSWVPPGTSGPAPPTNFVSDSFTDTNGVNLESHTGETGATWTKQTGVTGTFTVQTNRIFATGNTDARYYASGVPSSPNYDVTIQFTAVTNSGFPLVQALGRMDTSANTGYGAQILYNNGASTILYLRRWIAGSSADLTTTTITTPTAGTTHSLTLRMAGTSLSAIYDAGATTLGPFTDSNISAAGRAGVGHNGFNTTTTTGWHIDDLAAI